MVDLGGIESIHAVLDRARGRLSTSDLGHLVMGDPGTGGYIEAYRRVLAGGAPALEGDYDGTSLLRSFDIGENLLISHTGADRSPRHRWFSILTACIELLGWNGVEGLRFAARPPLSLYHLVDDSLALADSGDSQSPLELLPPLCRDLIEALDPHRAMSARLAELVVAPLPDGELDDRCRTLVETHESFFVWADDDGEPNPRYSAAPELVWGVLELSKAERRRWLALVEARFPTTTALARATRERLLADGRAAR